MYFALIFAMMECGDSAYIATEWRVLSAATVAVYRCGVVPCSAVRCYDVLCCDVCSV